MTRAVWHFDLIAPLYDLFMPRRADIGLLPELGTPEGGVILDMGGGTGRSSQPWQDSGWRIIVCDLSRSMLKQARARGLPVVMANAAHLPFASGACAWIQVVDAFHHFTGTDPAGMQGLVASEMARALGEEGGILVEEPDPSRLGGRAVEWIERALRMGSNLLRIEELEKLLVESGLRTVRVDRFGSSYRLVMAHPHQAKNCV